MTKQGLDLLYEIAPDYRRVNQRDLLFARLEWDPDVRALYDGLGVLPRSLERMVKGDAGYGLAEYALLSAGRYLDGFNDRLASSGKGEPDLYSALSFSTPGWTMVHEKWQGDPRLQAARQAFKQQTDEKTQTVMVKRAAQFLGAELVGVAAYDERWVYSHLYRRHSADEDQRWLLSRRSRLHDFPPDEEAQVLPLEMPQAKTVIVLAFQEDHGALNTSPEIVGAAASGLAYSRMAFTTASLAEFIRALGFWARAAGNDLALSIPFAAAAGLGELGRHGQLITREYGPRVRLSKVFTDMALCPDAPRPFGVWEYCKVCKKCAEQCPPGAIPFDDEPSWDVPSISSNSGVCKWHTNAELCSRYLKWNGGDCTNCQSRCPYNKDYSHWYHRLARDLAPRLGKRVASFALWLDEYLGYGRQASSEAWWKSAR